MLMHNSTSTEYETFNKKMANGIETDTVNLSIETVVKTNAVTMRNTHYSKSASVSPLGKKRRINIKDFDKICELGRGAFAKVDLRKCKLNNKLIAVKILNKHFMDKLNKSHEAYIEKEILSTLDHPNVIKLLNTFQDKNKLYFVLEYASNGDLSSYIRSQGALSYELARYYTAEIINGLEYLHIKKIAHRDLKPENMILNSDMHIKIVIYYIILVRFRYSCY
jgi:3-phosphoinositide dependent protein kinase-1